MSLGIEPRLLVEVGVGFGTRSFDSLADPLLDDGEGIMGRYNRLKREVLVEVVVVVKSGLYSGSVVEI